MYCPTHFFNLVVVFLAVFFLNRYGGIGKNYCVKLAFKVNEYTLPRVPAMTEASYGEKVARLRVLFIYVKKAQSPCGRLSFCVVLYGKHKGFFIYYGRTAG
jgi:hypothetical protein